MEIRNISFKYNKDLILKDVSFKIERKEITTLIGANGCGKTTLLYLMSKNLKPLSGDIYLGDKNLQNINLKSFAKKVAIVHQYNTAPSDLTVKGLVTYGRIPYRSFYQGLTDKDEETIEWAMEITDILELKDRRLDSLSGGQKQRVFIAMALAQRTEILFLDEPTTYLDIRYQIQILELLQKLNREYGMSIVMVIHDINQAICYSDRIVGMKSGQIMVQGKTNDVINRDTLYDIFNVHLKVMKEKEQTYVLGVSESYTGVD